MIRTKLSLAFTAVLFFSFLNWHCTKIDTTSIGSGLIPGVDNVNTFDTTLSVIANNFDSTLQGKNCTVIYPTDDHVLGTITNDPLFGTTKATLYTELKPSGFPFYLPAKPSDRTLDSIVLVLSYRRTFGDSTQPQSVSVFELSNNFKPDSSTCSSYAFNPTLLGSATYIPKNLKDTFRGKLPGDIAANVLRIKLSNSLGQTFITQDSSSISAFYSDSLFRVLFKGFALVPGNSGNALSYFNLTDANTRLALYYKYKRTGLTDTAVVTNFVFNTAANSANNIVRDHTTSEVVQNIAHPAAGDNFVYIQTSPGTYAELKIPGLSTLSNRIVHRAELILEQASPSPSDPFATPSFLYLDLKQQSDTFYKPIPCDFIAGNNQPDFTTFGGYRTTVNGASRYTFNLTRYVQRIITNKRENSTLRLRAPDYVRTPAGFIDDCGQPVSSLFFALNNVAYGRVKLVGGSAAPNRIRLHIIYSNL